MGGLVERLFREFSLTLAAAMVVYGGATALAVAWVPWGPRRAVAAAVTP